jgi:hypothetical protein
MYYKSKIFISAGVIIMAVFACSQTLYKPTFADSQKTGVSLDTLALGRKIYVNNCSSCHNLFKPEQFTIKKWEQEMPTMEKKAKISDHEATLIMKYISAGSN